MSGLRDELAALVASPDDTQEWENEGWRGVRQVQVIDVARLTALLDRFPPEAEGEAERFERVLYDHRDGALTCYDHTEFHGASLSTPAPRPTTEGGSSDE